MPGRTYDFTNDNDEEFHNLPHSPRSRPSDEDMRDIFEENGWKTWGDFYNDQLGLARDNPQASRPPLPNELDDLIYDFDSRGILRFVRFEIHADGLIEYEVNVES